VEHGIYNYILLIYLFEFFPCSNLIYWQRFRIGSRELEDWSRPVLVSNVVVHQRTQLWKDTALLTDWQPAGEASGGSFDHLHRGDQ
jgi:hypothetical protein